MNNSKEPVNPAFIRFTEDGKPFLGTPEQHSLTTLGLTKREHLSGILLQGILASQVERRANGYGNGPDDIKHLCLEAIDFADELLKQLENTK